MWNSTRVRYFVYILKTIRNWGGLVFVGYQGHSVIENHLCVNLIFCRCCSEPSSHQSGFWGISWNEPMLNKTHPLPFWQGCFTLFCQLLHKPLFFAGLQKQEKPHNYCIIVCPVSSMPGIFLSCLLSSSPIQGCLRVKGELTDPYKIALTWQKYNIFFLKSHLIIELCKLSPYLPDLTSAFLYSASQMEKHIKFIATAIPGPRKSLYPFYSVDYFLEAAVLSLSLNFLLSKNGGEKSL